MATKKPALGWLSNIPGPIVALAPIAVVTLRVIRVAHGNYTTELALIGEGKTLSVIFGSIAPTVPYLMVYLAVLLALWVRQRKHGRAEQGEQSRQGGRAEQGERAEQGAAPEHARSPGVLPEPETGRYSRVQGDPQPRNADPEWI